MSKFLKVVLSSFIVLVVTGSLVQAQQGNQPSAEEKEYTYRDSLFNVISFKSGQLGTAKAAGDVETFKNSAADIVALADMITEGFQIENNIVEGSLALPAIWEDFDDFTAKANVLRDAAQALVDSGDMEGFDPRGFGGTNCGGCHRNYKKR